MKRDVLFEICIDSVESALAAQEGGAQRVELCANLLEGGTTPSAGMIETVREQITIALNVMIRPRGGDFCYSDLEFATMRRDIETAKRLGANGVVFGILRPDGSIDGERSAELVALARPLHVTFHRAFDMARDPFAALEDLIALGIDRVLTSGQEQSVLEGLDTVAELVRRAGGRIIVMPGGGVTERNIRTVITISGAREIHFSGSSTLESRMEYRNTTVFMGGALHPPEFSLKVADAERIRAYAQALVPDGGRQPD